MDLRSPRAAPQIRAVPRHEGWGRGWEHARACCKTRRRSPGPFPPDRKTLKCRACASFPFLSFRGALSFFCSGAIFASGVRRSLPARSSRGACAEEEARARRCARVACGVAPAGRSSGEARALRCCRSFFFFVGVVCTCAPLPTRRRGASVRARPHGALAQRLRSLESEGCAARGTPARARAASPPKRAASRFPGCYWRPLARVGAAPPALAFPARGGGDDNSRQILAARSPQARARAAAGPPNATRRRLADPTFVCCPSAARAKTWKVSSVD